MRVLFLDFDGVLNTFTKFSHAGHFSKPACGNLNSLLERASDLLIVVTSAWRRHGLERVKEILQSNGIDSNRVIGITEYDNVAEGSVPRGVYIDRWLKQHPEVYQFVIIDDQSDMNELRSHLVKTNSWIGLTASDIKQALEILNK